MSPSTERKNIEAIYPVLPTQLGMLTHTLRAPRSGVYIEQICVRMAGDLQLDLFERAWETIYARTEALRSLFAWDRADQPLQIVRRSVAVGFDHEDWRQYDTGAREQRFQTFLEEDRTQGFDLKIAPLSRINLFRTHDAEHRLVWSFHHALLDGWSTIRLLRELFRLYGALANGLPVGPAPRGPAYVDFIAWFQQQDSAGAEAFWRSELNGLEGGSHLADLLGGSATSEPRTSFEQHEVLLTEAETASLDQFARQNRLTLNTVLQGAWAILLGRYLFADDVVLGATVSGRPAEVPGIDEMTGMFISTLPVRVRLPVGRGVVPWLRDLQQRQLECRRHGHVSLSDIQGWSPLGQDEFLFDTILVFENYPSSGTYGDAVGLQVEDVTFLEQSNFPLSLLVIPGRRLRLVFIRDPSILSPDAVNRLGCNLRTLLRGIVEDPARAPGEVPILSPEEESLVVHRWNRTERALSSDELVHELVSRVARENPDAVAVKSGGTSLSYGALDRISNAIADWLVRRGVGPDSCVPIYGRRSAAMVAGIIGVLKSGGAYVPLDSDYPSGRTDDVLARIAKVAGGKGLVGLVDPDVEPLDSEYMREIMFLRVEELAASTTTPPVRRVSSSNLAYVIFTSGSTGTPKGVEITHGNLLNSTLARRGFYPEQPERFLLLPPFSFDSSVAGIFWTLVAGGELIIGPPRLERHLDTLHEIVLAESITHLLCLPTIYEAILERADQSAIRSLSTVVVAGETCPSRLVARHFEVGVGARLYNEYGPTEMCVWCLVHHVMPDNAIDAVPVGRPIDNTRAYILDDNDRPVPIGAIGELRMAGAGMAKGYLGEPELTAERFKHCVIAGSPVQIYGTGDLARHRSNGVIEFLGRRDNQLKIRGIRVEPGEIESQLMDHPKVDACAVVAPVGVASRPTLVAYVVAGAGPRAEEPELREFLAQRLPDHMVPGRFLHLDRLPLAPNGKLDRRALPSVDEHPEPNEIDWVAPNGVVEEVLADVWKQVLGLERVGSADNFFSLGGHSLLALRVLSILRRDFGFDVALADLFDYPTIASLGAVLDEQLMTQSTEQ